MASTNTKPNRRPGWIRLTFGSALFLSLGVILTLFLSGQMRAFEVVGDSMGPTLEGRDRILARQISPSKLHRGDLIVVELPFEQDAELIKRLVALPGDIVYLNNAVLYVNGRPQRLPPGATSHPRTVTIPKTRLGKNQYFVLGDNRPISYDSEEFGPIPGQDIWGLVFVRYSPWIRNGTL